MPPLRRSLLIESQRLFENATSDAKGLFADATFAEMVERSPLMGSVPLRVTADSLKEAIKRVLDFCAFIDERRPGADGAALLQRNQKLARKLPGLFRV